MALPRFRPRLQGARSAISGDIVGVGRACPGAIRNADSDEAEVPIVDHAFSDSDSDNGRAFMFIMVTVLA